MLAGEQSLAFNMALQSQFQNLSVALGGIVEIDRTPKKATVFGTNFLQSLAAVLAGNAAYFLLMRFLPHWARHVPFKVDLGLAVDGVFCLSALAILKAVTGRNDE
jgi:hypothetical protein